MWKNTTTAAAAKVNNFIEAIYSFIIIFVVAIAFIIIIINSLCVFTQKQVVRYFIHFLHSINYGQ